MSILIPAEASLRASAPSAPSPFGARVRAVTMRATMTASLVAALTVAGAAQGLMAQSGAPATSFPKPDRPVADIVSPIWKDEKERDDAGEPGQLVRLLGIKTGMTVADLGAGSGYYVARLSPIVGSNGRIIAEDIVPEYLRGLRNRVRDLGLQNVTVTRGEPHDPRLPTGSVDVAILVHMYHEVTQPYGLLYNLVPAFKPGARIGIVDGFAPTSEHGTPPGLLRCELAAVGYHEVDVMSLAPADGYLAVFVPPATLPAPEAIRPCRQ